MKLSNTKMLIRRYHCRSADKHWHPLRPDIADKPGNSVYRKPFSGNPSGYGATCCAPKAILIFRFQFKENFNFRVCDSIPSFSSLI